MQDGDGGCNSGGDGGVDEMMEDLKIEFDVKVPVGLDVESLAAAMASTGVSSSTRDEKKAESEVE